MMDYVQSPLPTTQVPVHGCKDTNILSTPNTASEFCSQWTTQNSVSPAPSLWQFRSSITTEIPGSVLIDNCLLEWASAVNLVHSYKNKVAGRFIETFLRTFSTISATYKSVLLPHNKDQEAARAQTKTLCNQIMLTIIEECHAAQISLFPDALLSTWVCRAQMESELIILKSFNSYACMETEGFVDRFWSEIDRHRRTLLHLITVKVKGDPDTAQWWFHRSINTTCPVQKLADLLKGRSLDAFSPLLKIATPELRKLSASDDHFFLPFLSIITKEPLKVSVPAIWLENKDEDYLT